MSDTKEATASRLGEFTLKIVEVCSHLERMSGEANSIIEFAEVFLSKAPPALIRERSAEALANTVIGAFRFLEGTRRDEVDVMVANDVDHVGVTVLRTKVSERPFIVDSIREFLHAEELAISCIVYPQLAVQRDEGGAFIAARKPVSGDARESLVHCEVARVGDPDRLESLRVKLELVLQDVVRATDDFGSLIDSTNSVVADLAEYGKALDDREVEIAEIQGFMRWLRDGGFVFLGYRAYDLVDGPGGVRSVVVETGSGLGVLREEGQSRFALPVPVSELPTEMRDLTERGPLLIISKTNAESTVHRRARMDYIGVKKLGANGEAVGEHRFVGLFTSRAYSEDAEDIPILRQKLREILAGTGAAEGTHDYKEIITIFNSLPKEELFLASAEQVGDDIRTVLTTYHTSGVLVTLRQDPLRRGVAIMVIFPKDRFSGDVRKAIEAALVKELDGEVLNYHLAMGGGDQARLHFYMGATSERLAELDSGRLEYLVARITRTWTDRVAEGLEVVLESADEARRLATLYGNSFAAEYQAATDPEVAVRDILELEDMARTERNISIAFTNHPVGVAVAGAEGATELKVYLREERLILSDFMPILEDAGLRVLAVTPFDANGDVGRATLYAFAVQDGAHQRLDVDHCGEILSETILAARSGEALSSPLNALVLTAGLRWRQVDVLRAYAGYAFQIGAIPSRNSLPAALVHHPGIARELFELFAVKFDPDPNASRDERLSAIADIRTAFHGSLQSVSTLAEDRALRRLQELISATLRTNYYRQGGAEPTFRSGGVPYISLKFACRDFEFLERTKLLFEVWVHSSRVEGVHLRGSTVARGGIRWSDRPDDFRTEVLGLVKTQMVKNAVIVPGGSKGGFVTRRVFDDPDARFQEAKSQYQTLMRGLLDLTDNLVEGRPTSPDRVVAYDDPDPYLVVAADKGTATFSDLANGISAEYNFWLDDAFASGGSNGYDHKAVGITARGGWECVKRHFRERGKDIQSEPFTVVGIGDMSGDVFGNGMLLSEQIKLVAAFDHRHVFIDPDPDPAPAFAERKRIFELARSSWADYDLSLLSEGGMIVPRGAKEVSLSPQACRALGLPDDATARMDGETLIRAVLNAPVELLWNGGIGTYVKADVEIHADAGDPSNDAVRVNSSDLRCAVVGEGGNLGLTQKARIEYALRGGCINTDAIDNSGGVDMSDHEVNLKILLAPSVADSSMTSAERNVLLEELTEAVAELVLTNNRTQSLAISLDALRAINAGDDLRDLMFALEKSGELDRRSECLPTLDVLQERRDRGQTLVRPELCILLAYAKMSLMSNLLRSGLPDDPVTESYLVGYFPVAASVAGGGNNLGTHRLRREIIASQLTNDLVDLMGATFMNRLKRDTGRSDEQIVRAWLVASRLADHRALLSEMGKQQTAMNSRVTYRWLLGFSRVLERTTRWVIANVDPDVSPARIVDQNLEGLATLRESFSEIVAGEDRGLFEARVREIRDVGADKAFSQRMMTLRFLDQLLEILDICRETQSETMATGRIYYEVSEAFDVPWLRRSTFAAAGDDQWEQRAAQVLSEDLSRAHRRLVIAIVNAENSEPSTMALLLEQRSRDVARFKGIADELKGEETPSLAAVSVAAREFSSLADKMSRVS